MLTPTAGRSKPRRVRGISLIEIAIGLVILGILMTLGLPVWNTFLENRKIRSAAEVLVALLQQARVEAVKENVVVQFVMFDDDINVDDFSFIQGITPKADGRNWAVRRFDPITLTYSLVTARSGNEASGQRYGDSPSISVSGTVPSIDFNGFGATNGLGATATFQIVRANPNGLAEFKCVNNGPMRCLNVMVSTGGQVRMCDPYVTDAADTRKC